MDEGIDGVSEITVIGYEKGYCGLYHGKYADGRKASQPVEAADLRKYLKNWCNIDAP